MEKKNLLYIMIQKANLIKITLKMIFNNVNTNYNRGQRKKGKNLRGNL